MKDSEKVDGSFGDEGLSRAALPSHTRDLSIIYFFYFFFASLIVDGIEFHQEYP